MLSKLRGVFQLLRPTHWIKNMILFMPMVFSGLFLNVEAQRRSLIAFVFFSFAASLVYAINDIVDAERDRLHPVKRLKRPIASGAISKQDALAVGFVLLLASLSSFFFSPNFFLVLLAYIALNLAYSFYLKHQPVLDVFSVSAGFVLRVYAGAIAIDVKLSSWMLITTLSLALYLASIKRFQEMQLQGSEGRQVLKKYSAKIVERYADVAAVSTILFYSLYCFSEHPNLIVTIPLVLFGIFRYWYLVDAESQGESPVDVLYTDLPMILVVLLWSAIVVYEFFPKS